MSLYPYLPHLLSDLHGNQCQGSAHESCWAFVTFVKISIDGGHIFLNGVYRQTVRLSESEESLEKVCELRHGVNNVLSSCVSCDEICTLNKCYRYECDLLCYAQYTSHTEVIKAGPSGRAV